MEIPLDYGRFHYIHMHPYSFGIELQLNFRQKAHDGLLCVGSANVMRGDVTLKRPISVAEPMGLLPDT